MGGKVGCEMDWCSLCILLSSHQHLVSMSRKDTFSYYNRRTISLLVSVAIHSYSIGCVFWQKWTVHIWGNVYYPLFRSWDIMDWHLQNTTSQEHTVHDYWVYNEVIQVIGHPYSSPPLPLIHLFNPLEGPTNLGWCKKSFGWDQRECCLTPL